MTSNAEPRDPATTGADELGRRRFLSMVCAGVAGLIGAVIAIPFAGYVIGPLLEREPGQWHSLGEVDSFPTGKTTLADFVDTSSVPWAGQTASTAVWVRRNGPQEFTVFAVNCAHLGCPVNWLSEAQLFLCPCHGGVYYADGTVAAGPPPRRLFEYKVRIQNKMLQALAIPLPTD